MGGLNPRRVAAGQGASFDAGGRAPAFFTCQIQAGAVPVCSRLPGVGKASGDQLRPFGYEFSEYYRTDKKLKTEAISPGFSEVGLINFREVVIAAFQSALNMLV